MAKNLPNHSANGVKSPAAQSEKQVGKQVRKDKDIRNLKKGVLKSHQRESQERPQTSTDFDLQQLEKIFELIEKHEIAELEWEKKGSRVKLKTKYAVSGPSSALLAGKEHRKDLSPSGDHFTLPDPSIANVTKADATPGMNGSGSLMRPSTGIAPEAQVVPVSPAPPARTNQREIASPFVGTFYRSGSPGSEPYVKEGQIVKRGDVICIIEAMKLMNEIESEASGKVVSILVENGQPVEYGEPLFILEN